MLKEIFGVFGQNKRGQLGHGDTINRNIPTKIQCLKDIQQISHGCYCNHFLAKDSQNKIYVTGCNMYRQLGIGKNVESTLSPQEMNSQYFEIWGDILISRAKSARK